MPTQTDHRTEKAVLGALLIDGDAIRQVGRVLAVDDFAHAHGRRIYRAMLALASRGLHVDYVTVCSEMERDGSLARVGEATLTEVINWAPCSLSVLDYARALVEEARLRRGEAVVPEPPVPEPEVEAPYQRLSDRLGLDDDEPVPTDDDEPFDPNESF